MPRLAMPLTSLSSKAIRKSPTGPAATAASYTCPPPIVVVPSRSVPSRRARHCPRPHRQELPVALAAGQRRSVFVPGSGRDGAPGAQCAVPGHSPGLDVPAGSQSFFPRPPGTGPGQPRWGWRPRTGWPHRRLYSRWCDPFARNRATWRGG